MEKEEPMTKLTIYTSAILFGLYTISNAALSAEVNQDEVKICIEAVKEIVKGTAQQAAAIKLCEQGKTEEALQAAMDAAGGG